MPLRLGPRRMSHAFGTSIRNPGHLDSDEWINNVVIAGRCTRRAQEPPDFKAFPAVLAQRDAIRRRDVPKMSAAVLCHRNRKPINRRANGMKVCRRSGVAVEGAAGRDDYRPPGCLLHGVGDFVLNVARSARNKRT